MAEELFYITDEFGNIVIDNVPKAEADEKIEELKRSYPDETYYINNELF